MKNIAVFLRRYANFLFFVVLQIFCLYLIVSYNKYHEAMFGAVANRFTGNINKQYDKAEYYFQLKKTNDSLVRANEELYNLLKANYNLPDSSMPKMFDTIRVDSIIKYRAFTYKSAKVVSATVNSPANYIILYGDQVPQFYKGMGVVNINNAVIGTVTEVDGKYATVMSLLHKDSHISGKLFRTGETGTISWEGEIPNELVLKNIPKSVKIVRGDSVITSGMSTIFPKGLMIGTVDTAIAESKTNYQNVVIKTAANFYGLEFGYGILNPQTAEIKPILNKIKNPQGN